MNNKKPQRRKMERTVEFLPDFELGRRRRAATPPPPPAAEIWHAVPTFTPTPTWIEPAKRARGGNSGGSSQPMNEVEREIARADMAYLIQKEKENGDWDKWLKDQAHWREIGKDGPVVEERARRIINAPDGPVVRRRR